MLNKLTKNINIILTIGSMIVWYLLSYGLNFYLTSYITKRFGIEATGFINLAKNFVSYATIVTMAVNAYAVRYIVIAFHEGDQDKVNRYFSTVLIADLFLGFTLLLFSIPAIVYLEHIVNISPDIVEATKLLFAFTFFSFFINVAETAFTIYAYAKNKLFLFYFGKIVGTASEIILLLILFSYADGNIWYVGLGAAVAALSSLICNLIFNKKYFPTISFRVSFFSRGAVKELVAKGVWSSVNQLGNVLNSGLDLYFSNLLFDSVAMGEVSIAKTIGMIPSTIYTTLSQTFRPKLIEEFTKNNTDGVIYYFKKSIKINCIFMIVIFAGFFAVGKEFYGLWIPGENIDLIYNLTIITLLTCVIECASNSLCYTYTLTLKNKIPCLITVAGGLINAFGMVLLSKYTSLGIYSIVITTLIVMSIINIVSNPLYICKCLRIPLSTFYPLIFYSYLSCALVTLALFGLNCLFNFNFGWLSLIIKIIIFGLIGGFLAFALLFNPLKQIIRKRR